MRFAIWFVSLIYQKNKDVQQAILMSTQELEDSKKELRNLEDAIRMYHVKITQRGKELADLGYQLYRINDLIDANKR